ncbi:MAG TPA: DNA mismatch repair protein MutS [Thermoanaerobaculia bacterium]|nr:DNA mismatch repair protein MutS [Thermoanaerobaculia bacterium]
MLNPRELYTQRLASRRADAARLAARDRMISTIRLIVIAIAIVLLFVRAIFALIPVAVFIALLVMHERVITARRRAEAAAAFYTRGLARLDGTWIGHGVSGEEFVDEHHLFSGDLDLFGRGSIFELLCIAVTHSGRRKLASWLASPSTSVPEIVSRQEAVKELRDRVELREDVAIVGAEVAHDIEQAKLDAWGAMPPTPFARWEPFVARALGILAAIIVAISLPSAIAKLVGYTHPQAVVRLGPFANVPLWPLVVVILIEALFAARMRARITPILTAVERAEPALALLGRVLMRIENESFTSQRFVDAVARLRGRVVASAEIERLRKLVALLDARRNQFFAPIGAILLWTTNLAFAIERWRVESGRAIGAWIETVAEIEALGSLASLSFEHPDDFTMPDIIEEGRPLFDAGELGHPLIPGDRRVTNDIILSDTQRLLVVSGSNMSGKSTMLRSVGVAAVLAMAGGPVCARKMVIAPMKIGASIRINDSLQEGASRFYAEILRIRHLLENAPLLFLLDEILAGTNSHDRRIGAEAIVRGLVERGAIGLVSTHDLALAEIAKQLPNAANVHFEDHLEGDRVAFDYRMRPGVVTKSNALALMRSVGIEV